MANKQGNIKRRQPQPPAKGQARQRSKGKIKGSGNYTVPIAALAAKVAKMIPKGTFESVGKNMGGRLGRGLAGITGVGDYVVNDIVNPVNVPRKGGAHVQTISNVEYIRDITAPGNSGFNLTEFAVNAANPQVFPWLSNVTKLYTKYRFKQLLFEYRSTSSEYAATVGMGSVVMAPQYNIDSTSFTTKQQMEAATNAVSFKPSLSSICGIECSPDDNNLKWYMVRDSYTTPTMFTDPLSFAVAVNGSGVASGIGLGELWVHYTVDLLEPILSKADLGVNGESGVWANFSTAPGAITNGAFGWQSTIPADLGYQYYNAGNVKIVRRDVAAEGLPTGVDWDICYDPVAAYRFYFSKPAVYTFTVTSKFSTAPTNPAPTAYGMWTVGSMSAGTTSGDLAESSSADRTMISDTFVVNTDRANASCDVALTFGWTTAVAVLAGTGLNAQGCKVQITVNPKSS